MTTRPTDTPRWGTIPSGGSQVIEPPDGLQDRGWLAFNKPPAAFVNWAWNRFGDWVAHFASTASRFPTLQGAANAPATAPLVVGDSCLIDEDDGGIPGALVTATIDSVLTVAIIDADAGSDGILYAGIDGGGLRRIRLNERDGSGLIREYVATNAITNITKVLYDGVDVIASYDDGIVATVESWDAATGVSNWVVTPVVGVVTIEDMAWDDSQIYITSALAAGELKALSRATGATNYTFDHGAALRSIATNGVLVFVQGPASAHASGATLRGIVAVNGFDATGEGGLGTDAFLAWDIVEVTPNITTKALATNNRTLYTHNGAGLGTLHARGCSNGVSVVSVTPSVSPVYIRVDQDNVYLTGTSLLFAYDKTSLAEIWRLDPVTPNNSIATDGAALFFQNDNRARGNQRPTAFRRLDPSAEKQLLLRQLLVPVDS
jgi:hypothetical protein